MTPELKKKIQKWIEQDINEQDKQELQNLLERALNNDKEAESELKDRFSEILQFGTAGLRGKMEAGPNRMCSSVVAKTAYAIAEWGIIKEKMSRQPPCEYVTNPDGTGMWIRYEETLPVKQLKVVIGFDARYNSKHFAILSAKIFMEQGYDVLIFKNFCPTPVLAYSIKKLKADIGIMVTASHNPAADNGYKVYLGGNTLSDVYVKNNLGDIDYDGAQIVPPTDEDIAEEIEESSGANEIEQSDEPIEYVPDNITDNYIKDACTYNFNENKQDKNISIVYTAMHGVGKNAQIKALIDAGYKNIHLVEKQVEPDPDFPTVSFPNPEEDGAMDLSLESAKKNNADIILANDPDADRIAVGALHNEEYVLLTGDEVGIILTNYFINKIKKDNLDKSISSSIVSSSLPKIMCTKNNVKHYSTLTGLKWIVRAPNIIFGYEEALGYCPMPNKVHDKDGVSTGVLIAHIAAELKKQGKTLVDLLTSIAEEYGLYTQSQLSVRLDSKNDLLKLVEKFRKNPPKTLLGEKVKEVVDMSENPPEEHLKQNAISILTEKKTRVFIRPSGTEPKVKFYLEVVGKPNERDKNIEKLEALKKELSG